MLLLLLLLLLFLFLLWRHGYGSHINKLLKLQQQINHAGVFFRLGIVSSLMEHCVEKTLTFLSTQGPSILYANYHDNQRWKMAARGVHEIQRFLAILSSLFDKHILRDNDETLDILDNLKDQRYSASCSSSETASGRSSSIPASDTNTVISSFAYAFIWAFGGDLHERLALS